MMLNKNQRGLTLIELMVGLAIALIASLFIANIYIQNIASTTDVTASNRLEADMRSSMALMVEEIRRAGFWGGAVDESTTPTTIGNPSTNPFTTVGGDDTNIAIDEKTGETANSCITFSYDRNEDGDYNGDDDEHRGFRLNAGKLDIRTSADVDGGTAGDNCDSGNWESMTDDSVVNISAVTFGFVTGDPGSMCINASSLVTTDCDGNALPTGESQLACWKGMCSDAGATGYIAPTSGDTLIEQRLVSISMTGNLVDDATVTKTLNENVQVRNHRIYLEP